MRKAVSIFLSMFCLASVYGQHIEHVSPQYSGDKDADLMIQYIADHLQIVIPPDKTMDNLAAQMRCKITVDNKGSVADIQILKHTVLWLELAIVDGLKRIPPTGEWNFERAEQLQKELVFSFGRRKRTRTEYGMDSEKIADNLDSQLEQDRQQQKKEYAKADGKWKKVKEGNLRIEMPLSPERGKNTNPVLKPPQTEQKDDDRKNISNIQISLE